MSAPAIAVGGLVRDFGNVRAVDGLTFSIPSGHVVGFIGANGAGKTTTMRMLVTLEQPDEGSVSVCGIDAREYPNEVRRRVGWMPDAFGTYDNMTVFEYLDFYGRAFGLPASRRAGRIAEVMEFTDLLALADRPMNRLSKGMGQRLCLGRTLVHDPELLVLDEPAAGLDPKARIEFKNLVRLLADRGKTIFISSHILSELGEMCDSLLFIDAGRLVHQGTTESLVSHQADGVLVEIRIHGPLEPFEVWVGAQPGLRLHERTAAGARVVFDSEDPAYLSFNLRRMVSDGIQVCGFARVERRLEEAFIEVLRDRSKP